MFLYMQYLKQIHGKKPKSRSMKISLFVNADNYQKYLPIKIFFIDRVKLKIKDF